MLLVEKSLARTVIYKVLVYFELQHLKLESTICGFMAYDRTPRPPIQIMLPNC